MRFHLCKLMAKYVFYDFLISSCNYGFRFLMQCDLFLSVHYLFLSLHDLFPFFVCLCFSVICFFTIYECMFTKSLFFVCLSSSAWRTLISPVSKCRILNLFPLSGPTISYGPLNLGESLLLFSNGVCSLAMTISPGCIFMARVLLCGCFVKSCEYCFMVGRFP